MNAKKNKKQVISSSDEENSIKSSHADKRVSHRLKRKCGKDNFVMPSRDKIWDSIPSEYSEKPVSPRKTVNNFTKVYNTYNYDDYEDTSDDDEQFIVDSCEDSNEETPDPSDNEKQTPGRVKNFRRRIKINSSSDEDKVKEECNDFKCEQSQSTAADHDRVVDNSSTTEVVQVPLCQTETHKELIYRPDNVLAESDSVDSSEEEISPTKRCRNVSVLDSSESSSDESMIDHHEVKIDHANSRSSLAKKKKDELFQKFKDIRKQRKVSEKF